MVIYEVNLEVNLEVKEAFSQWLDKHIQEIIALQGFESASWLEQVGTDSAHQNWTVQYRLKNRVSLDNYLNNHAPHFREDGMKRFGGKFQAHRRVFEVVKRY